MSVETYTPTVPSDPGSRMEEKERRGIQSIEIGSQLLVELARHVAPMALRDLAKAAGMSTGKAHMRTHALRRTLGADAAGKTKKAPADPSPTRKKKRFVDDYLPALLGQASHLISSEFHQVVNANGFTVSEWRVLASLEGGEAVSIGSLAATSLNKQPTLTRMLDRMEERGQVERVPHEGGDRRITLVRITPLGSQTVSHLIALASKHAEHVLEPLGKKRAEELKAMLRTIIELHQDPDTDT